jgi:RNA polymerase sigma factor (sigma-70 family)
MPGADRGRMEKLYSAYGPEAGRLALLMTGDRELAADLAQEAFIKAAARFYDLRFESSFRAYLRTTVINLTNSHFRHVAVERKHLARVAGFPRAPSSESELGDRDLLERALQALPHRQRAAVVLHHCMDLSLKRTAEAMGTTDKAVESLLQRGLAALRTELEEQG